MTTAERRRYNRDRARRIRAAEMEQRRAGRPTCPRRFGRFGLCGAALEYRTDGHGQEVIVCPACARLARGICADCPRPVAGTVGKARRCASCKERVYRASQRRSQVRHRDVRNARQRARYHADQGARARRNERKRLWRLAHPEKVAAQKRRYVLRQTESYRTYQKAYRAERRAAIAARERARYHDGRPTRRCISCRTAPVEGRRKKCDPCRERQRARAAALLSRTAGRGRRTDLERRGRAA